MSHQLIHEDKRGSRHKYFSEIGGGETSVAKCLDIPRTSVRGDFLAITWGDVCASQHVNVEVRARLVLLRNDIKSLWNHFDTTRGTLLPSRLD